MWFLDTTSELEVVNRRIDEMRREISGLRFAARERRPRRGLGAALDAGIVRLTSGAARRHANRQSRTAALRTRCRENATD